MPKEREKKKGRKGIDDNQLATREGREGGREEGREGGQP
jgi:hypothetical protein